MVMEPWTTVVALMGEDLEVDGLEYMYSGRRIKVYCLIYSGWQALILWAYGTLYSS